jgi:hypothetical protein
MPGIHRELVEHVLNVNPKARPVKQPLRRFDQPKRKAIAAKLHRLKNTNFIKKIKTSSWVSNPVIVPKKNTNVINQRKRSSRIMKQSFAIAGTLSSYSATNV